MHKPLMYHRNMRISKELISRGARTYLQRATALGVIATSLLIAAPAGAATSGSSAPKRVLLLALPTVTWADVKNHDLPNLEAFLQKSSMANLMLRTTTRNTDAGDGYTTIGAGTRSTGGAEAGQVLEEDERYGGTTAADIYERRTGYKLNAPGGAISFPALVAENNEFLFDSKPGAFTNALIASSYMPSVIANADHGEATADEDRLHREAALALIDTTGRLPGGELSSALLRKRNRAPFGLELNPSKVVEAFDRAWRDRSVVLVEASDLARADAYRLFVSPAERRRQRIAALEASDRMIGQLLDRVDTKRDLVIAFGAFHPSYERNLGLFAMRGPGIEAGLTQSGTTNRPGYISLQDVAPTALAQLQITAPEMMEGRPAKFAVSKGSFDDRVSQLSRENFESQFRDSVIGTAMVALAIAVVLIASLLILQNPEFAKAKIPFAGLCLAVLGMVAATFLSAPLPFYIWGAGAYWLFVVTFALIFGATCTTLRRFNWLLPTAVATGFIVALHTVDTITGTRLQFATVFGYSPSIGVRISGLGNPASAQLSASALVLATILAAWIGGKRGVRVAAILLGFVLVVVAAPPWGQDFGGALSNAPAFAVFLWLAAGKQIKAKSIALFSIALLIAGLLVGFADLTRPRDSRTHVGRFFEKIGNEGIGGFATVVERKAGLMLNTFLVPTWVIATIALLAFLAFLGFKTPWIRRLNSNLPTLRAGAISFATMAVLGLLLNDSGVTVPGMMLAIMVPCLLSLIVLQPWSFEFEEPALGSESESYSLTPLKG